MRFWGLLSSLFGHRHRWEPSELDVNRGACSGRWGPSLWWWCVRCGERRRTAMNGPAAGWRSYMSPDGKLTLVVDPEGHPYATMPPDRWVPVPE